MKNEEYMNGEAEDLAYTEKNTTDEGDAIEASQPTLDSLFDDKEEGEIFPAEGGENPEITEELICEDLLGYEGKDIEAMLEHAQETEAREEEIPEGVYEFKESEELICEDLLGYEEHAKAPDGESEDRDPTEEEQEEPSEDDGEENPESPDEATDEEIAEEDGEDEEHPSPDNKKEEAQPEKPRRVDTIFDLIEVCIFTLAAVFMLMSFFFRYSIVDGGSMMNTLQHQERLLLTSFLYTPECGDVVVIQDKTSALKDPIVKRIIAVGGQTVKFTRTDVYVDGVKLDEPYVYTGDYTNSYGMPDVYRYSVYPSDELLDLVTDYVDGVYYEILVPEGEIFVMGDHRNNSKDSRDIGTLHEDAIIGKAIYRFFPFDKFGKIE